MVRIRSLFTRNDRNPIVLAPRPEGGTAAMTPTVTEITVTNVAGANGWADRWQSARIAKVDINASTDRFADRVRDALAATYPDADISLPKGDAYQTRVSVQTDPVHDPHGESTAAELAADRALSAAIEEIEADIAQTVSSIWDDVDGWVVVWADHMDIVGPALVQALADGVATTDWAPIGALRVDRTLDSSADHDRS